MVRARGQGATAGGVSRRRRRHRTPGAREFYEVAKAANIPECDRLARTIRRWEREVLAYYSSDGLSNARTEAVNGLMKKMKRIGHGFRNLGNYRLRLHCGGVAWQDQPAAKLRKRTPQLVA